MGNTAQDEIVRLGTDYIMLTAWALIPMAITFSIGTSFREIARPAVPLVFSAIATVVTTSGNWLLIYGNLGAPRMEVEGAAFSTVIARAVEVTLFVLYTVKIKASFFVSITKIFAINWKFFREILHKSGMIFASEMSWIASETLMVAMYNRRGGAEVVAGMAAGWAIANVFFLLFGGIWTASGVLVGGSLGAGKLEQARSRSKWLQSGSLVAGIVTALPGAALSAVLVPLVFSSLSIEARINCINLVLVILAYLPIWCYLNVLFAITRSGGDTATGMYADLFVNTLMFAPLSIVFSFFTPLSPVAMFALLKLTDFAKLFIARHFMKKERWVRNLTLRDVG